MYSKLWSVVFWKNDRPVYEVRVILLVFVASDFLLPVILVVFDLFPDIRYQEKGDDEAQKSKEQASIDRVC